MSDRTSSPNLIESGLKSLIGGARDNYPLISGTNGKHQLYDDYFHVLHTHTQIYILLITI